MATRLLVLADSLAYHGPERAELPTDPRLWPNVLAAGLAANTGGEVSVDLFARLGWTARDAWWALTRDPRCWGEALPAADALVIGVGGMDHLPAAVPTYLREGIAYVRPGWLRRQVRAVYNASAPTVMRVTRGRMRQLPQSATDHYLARVVEAARFWRPGLPVLLLGPAPFDSAYYPVVRTHEPAVSAARAWAVAHDTAFLDVDPLVRPSLLDGSANPDGMHWSWAAHEKVGAAAAVLLAGELSTTGGPMGTEAGAPKGTVTGMAAGAATGGPLGTATAAAS